MWITFKYERLPTFCVFYGMIGHSDRFCEKLYDCEVKPMEMPYGVELRAMNHRDRNLIGEWWLRSSTSPSELTKAGSVMANNTQMVMEDLTNQARRKEIDGEKMVCDNMGDVNP